MSADRPAATGLREAEIEAEFTRRFQHFHGYRSEAHQADLLRVFASGVEYAASALAAHPEPPEADPTCDDDACPRVGQACPYPAAGCGANDPEADPRAGERGCRSQNPEPPHQRCENVVCDGRHRDYPSDPGKPETRWTGADPDAGDDAPRVDLRATDRILIAGGNPALAECIREQNCTCGHGPEPAEIHVWDCPYWDGTYPDTPRSDSAEPDAGDALELVLRQSARARLGLDEGDYWDSTISGDQATAVMNSDWLAADRAATAERIAQAIERELRQISNPDTRDGLRRAARIARGEGR